MCVLTVVFIHPGLWKCITRLVGQSVCPSPHLHALAWLARFWINHENFTPMHVSIVVSFHYFYATCMGLVFPIRNIMTWRKAFRKYRDWKSPFHLTYITSFSLAEGVATCSEISDWKWALIYQNPCGHRNTVAVIMTSAGLTKPISSAPLRPVFQHGQNMKFILDRCHRTTCKTWVWFVDNLP